ncbi:MAG: hypothetical protein A2X64_00050 [Ignavibacteria bacterium GWF2_33_9]|nr:MAG: hypothetical protein A2X64_00050 [Ignavibacteria bacterium GWF2_33_9]
MTKALVFLYKNDSVLLETKYNINERTVTHRLGMYLAEQFPEFDVDCEYNRMEKKDDLDKIINHISKSLRNIKDYPESTLTNDTKAVTVYPDIIVHKRKTDINLLVIEVKMGWKKDKAEFDRIKLEAYKEQLKYKFAVFLIIGENNSEMEWF